MKRIRALERAELARRKLARFEAEAEADRIAAAVDARQAANSVEVES